MTHLIIIIIAHNMLYFNKIYEIMKRLTTGAAKCVRGTPIAPYG